jgi:NADPH2:quinone reductase
MKAWRVHEFGEPRDVLVLDDIAPPTPADLDGMGMTMGGWAPLSEGAAPFDDWVILDVSVAALALPDVTMARGTYPVPVPRPYVSGQEAVGIVTAAAPGRQDLVGKRVVTVTIQPWGGLADVAVGVSQLFEVPEQLSDEEAAGFLIAAHTAYHATIRRGAVTAGETVAVLGAAGGVGSAAVQLCVAAGADVIAVVGSEEKAAFCMNLGARAAVDHNAAEGGDFSSLIKLATDGRGVDVVIDPVQGQMGAIARDAIVPNGRHVLCGHAGGLIPHDPHFYIRNHTLVGVTLGGYGREEMQRIHAESHEALTALLEAGKFRPQVTQSVAFADVPRAVTDLAERRTMGRVVVRVRD